MRYTEKRNGKNVIPLRNAVCGFDMPKWSIAEESDIQSFLSGDAVDRLAELEEKIENGTLIELPCKVGDTFWYLSVAGYIEEDKIANFSLYGEFFTGERVVTKLYKNYLGRTWFLTREEAEKRLKELQE